MQCEENDKKNSYNFYYIILLEYNPNGGSIKNRLAANASDMTNIMIALTK